MTIVEAAVVLAVVGIMLVAGTLWNQRGPSTSLVAQELVQLLVVMRWAAVHEGLPRTVLSSPSGDELRVAYGSFLCNAEGSGTRTVWSSPPRVSVGWPAMSVSFAPDGRPRRCDGSAVGNTTILIEGPRGDRAAVIVASLGRVRWERR